jgi:serine/threonine protein phosphatase PrpC
VASKPFKDPNQDAGGVYHGTHYSALAIADGLGSSLDAHIASTLAVKNFLAGVEDLDQQAHRIDPDTVRQLWERMVRALAHRATHNTARYRNQPHALQTTCTTVIELPDSYLISYLGNGSLFHMRGDFWSFWERRWPWCVTDLMLGHSFLNETGKDTLYGILSPSGLTADIRFLQLWKDTTYGDLLVLCSDGISSSDHLRVGRDANDKLWLEVNPHLDALLNQFLKPYFAQLGQSDDTAAVLDQALHTFLAAPTFDDDATVGILVSSHAKNYYQTHHPDPAA